MDRLRRHLQLLYQAIEDPSVGNTAQLKDFITMTFPSSGWSALEFLPARHLPKAPLELLLQGFETDLAFLEGNFPIKDEAALENYATAVASTIGVLCLHLVFHHCAPVPPPDVQRRLVAAGATMGQALQYINMARDVAVDADLGRVYLPTTWLDEHGLSPEEVLEVPGGPRIEVMRRDLLQRAFRWYDETRGVMRLIPRPARAPMMVAVESYMEIGRVLREGTKGARRVPIGGRAATVPRSRRIWVAWRTMAGC